VFENIFRKEGSGETAATAAPQPVPAAPALSPEDQQAWHDRIAVAAGAGDDVALLQLAHDAPVVPLKLAAIEALAQEASLRQAMHDFREHDKRLYRAAKSRWENTHGKRVTTEEAQALIASAHALLDQESAAVNRVVDLDRAWAALDANLVDEALRNEFAALSEQLGVKVRARGEHVQAVTRWLPAIDDAMARLQGALPGIASGESPPAIAEPLALTLLEHVQANPDAADSRCATRVDTANRLLAVASSVTQRAAFLLTLPVANQPEGEVRREEALEKQLTEQWRAFPEMAETIGSEWHSTLAARFAEWRNAVTEEREMEQAALSAEERERRREQNKQRVQAIERDVEAAEAAHTAGHVGDLTRLLAVIDTALKRGAVNATLHQRIEVLRAEQRRLHDWQRWGGRQSREQVVAEAQALAEAATGKVSVKAHADAIDKLRERWKELDKLGAASNQVMWLNFDGALKKAYAPVGAHLEKLKAERSENLAKREQIVQTLTQAAAKFFPAAAEGTPSPAPATKPDWRAVGHALEEAQMAWRKLGPVEHTVPRRAQKGDNAITTRYAAAVQALEGPIKAAHDEARGKRDALIKTMQELLPSAQGRDVIDKVKKIQSQWQSVAKTMPLPRRDENALWTTFKTAIDAIFTARDAARTAAEAEINEKLKARNAIIDVVSALAAASSSQDIKRGLQEAESQWRAAPEAPRALAAKIDTRYRAAREAASRRVGELARHAEQARYDALLDALNICAEREASGIGAEQTAALEERWNAISQLPAAWKTRMDARFTGSNDGKPGKKGESLEDVLLNLEVACSIDSPENFLAARQRLKILALKNAMEGRQNTTASPADIERWMLDAASSARPDELSRERLNKIIAAVRRRPARQT
jgi:exonuclease SbcC